MVEAGICREVVESTVGAGFGIGSGVDEATYTGGRLRLTAKASDSSGVARVVLRIDGHRVRARRAAKLSYRWRLRPGRHRIGVIAYDKRGNRNTYVLKLRLPGA